MNVKSPYNAILKPFLNTLGTVVSSFYQMMKFPMENRVGRETHQLENLVQVLPNNHQERWPQWWLSSSKWLPKQASVTRKSTNHIEVAVLRDESRESLPSHVEETTSILRDGQTRKSRSAWISSSHSNLSLSLGIFSKITMMSLLGH